MNLRSLNLRALFYGGVLLTLGTPAVSNAQNGYTWKNAAISGAGAMVTGVLAHPLQQGLFYIRTDVGGSYRWDSANSKWIPLNDSLTFAQNDWFCCEGLAIDPSNVNILYYAGGLAIHQRNGAIFKSTDKGTTWTQLTGISLYMNGNGDRRWAGERLVVDPFNSSVVLFGSRKDGLWRSADGGTTWAAMSSMPIGTSGYGVQSIAFDSTTNGKVYAYTTGGAVYVSTDHGVNWTSIGGSNVMRLKVSSNGTLWATSYTGVCKFSAGVWTTYTLGGTANICCGLGINPTNPNDILVEKGQSSPYSIWRTVNGGGTWTSQTYTVASTATWSTPGFINYRPSDFVFDPFNASIVWGDRWRTTDINAGTVAWVQQESGHEEDVCGAVIAPPSGTELLLGVFDDDGFSMSSGLDTYPSTKLNVGATWNGHTWNMAYQETNPLNMIRVGGQKFYGGPNRLVAKSINGGANWNQMSFPANLFPLSCAMSATDGNNMVVISDAYYSGDGSGNEWKNLIAATNPCQYTTNGGSSWTAITGITSVPSSYGPWGDNQFLAADHVNGSKFYYLEVNTADNTSTGKILNSVDGGANFSQANPASLLPASKRWYELKTLPGVEGDVWACMDNHPSSGRTTDEGLYHSTNSGATWTKLSSVNRAFSFGFGKPPTGSSTAALYIYGRVNGGSVDSIYRSLDLGVTWINIQAPNNNLSDFPSFIEGSRQTFGRVFVGTGGRGVFYGSVGLTGTVAAQPATVDLTAEGTLDWGQWALNNAFNHKAAGGSKISNITYIGAGTVWWNTGEPTTFNWTDGTPAATGPSTAVKSIHNLNCGFQFTAPADTAQRTLKVFVKGIQSKGTLTARLSDSSSPDFVDASQSSQTGSYYALYTLNYSAAAAGQTLTVKWVTTTDYSGNNSCSVGIQAAILK